VADPLALPFKPGCLTSEFLAGRRMKYLPPFRLYLVLSLPFFLIVTLLFLLHNLNNRRRMRNICSFQSLRLSCVRGV
jgi:Protein of unknown function (DUF3667)